MRRLLVAAVAAALLLPAVLVSPPASRAQEAPAFQPDATRREPVFPGVVYADYDFRLGSAPQNARVISFGAYDPLLELTPVLGTGRIPGLETITDMGRRLLEDGAVAGINGGFWLTSPVGEPNGYFVLDGVLVSNSETQGTGPRGTFAIAADGDVLIDRVDTRIVFGTDASDQAFIVHGLNRGIRRQGDASDPDEAVLAYTSAYGPEVEVRRVTTEVPVATPATSPASGGDDGDGASGSPSPSPSPSSSPSPSPSPSPPPTRTVELPVRTFVVEDLLPQPASDDDGGVVTVHDGPGTYEIPESSTVVVAYGRAAETLAVVQPGARAALTNTFTTERTDPVDWIGIEQAVAAGPQIVADGRPTDPEDWVDEGFDPRIHSAPRAPRSAFGVTEEGVILMVGVDGRRSGSAAGMTIAELADFMVSIGARDAISLDGGASTQVVTDGRLRNTPCCDESPRTVADGLFVTHRYEFAATRRLAGSSRLDTAAAVAADGHPAGADEVLRASAANFPDALAGGPLAYARDAPLLLTGPEELSERTAESLAELGPERVTVLGGRAAVSEVVLDELEELGYEVERISGPTRTATAAAVAEALGEEFEEVFLASAGGFPDALTAAPPAALLGVPVLLTGTDELSVEAREEILDSGAEQVIVPGGEAAVSDDVTDELEDLGLDVVRLAGEDRFATAEEVNRYAEDRLACGPLPATPVVDGVAGGGTAAAPCVDESRLVVARGDDFPDALSGGPYAARQGALLMILPALDYRAADGSERYLASRDDALASVTLLGGHAGLSSYEQWQLDQLAQSPDATDAPDAEGS